MLQRIFNGLWFAAAMVIGICAGMLLNAAWPPGFEPQQTLTLTAAIVGAIGTWAVGIGAMHYARESHALRATESRAAYVHELVEIQAHLVSCEMAKLIFDQMTKDTGHPSSIESRHIALRSILSIVPSSPISGRKGIPEIDRPLAHSIDLAAATMRTGAEQFMALHPVGTNRSKIQDDFFDHTIGQMKNMAALAVELRAKMRPLFETY